MSSQVQAALELLKRLPPSPDSISNLLLFLTPAQQSALLSKASVALHALYDPDSARDFLCCGFNQEGSSYRSPYSGRYYPPLEDGYEPSTSLRRLEIRANELFSDYVNRYYGAALSSVYFSQSSDKAGISACFAVLKSATKKEKSATVSAVHYIDMVHEGNDKKLFQVSSRLQLCLKIGENTLVSGNFITSKEEKTPLLDSRADAESLQLLRIIEDSECGLMKQFDNFVSSRIQGTLKAVHWQRPANEEAKHRARYEVLMGQLLEAGMGIRGSDSTS
jgi:capping protein beta